MKRTRVVILCGAVALAPLSTLLACEATHASRDEILVRLPAGDAVAGRRAFDDLRCWVCHGVEGCDFPAPVASPPVGVTLGSKWDRRMSDQELTWGIVDPSHQIDDAYEGGVIRSGDRSRMGSFLHMEVEQLVDIVAFLRDVNARSLAK